MANNTPANDDEVFGLISQSANGFPVMPVDGPVGAAVARLVAAGRVEVRADNRAYALPIDHSIENSMPETQRNDQ